MRMKEKMRRHTWQFMFTDRVHDWELIKCFSRKSARVSLRVRLQVKIEVLCLL